MKLCIVSSYPPNRGNLAEYCSYLVDQFKKSKKFDKIILISDKSDLKAEGNEKSIKVNRCWERNQLSTPLKILYNLWKGKPDLVFFNISLTSWGKSRIVNGLCAFLPFLSKIITGKKAIVSLHNVGEAVDINEIDDLKDSWINRLGMFVATRSILSADTVCVTLKGYVKILGEKYRTKNIVYVPHGCVRTRTRKPKVGRNSILAFGHWSKRKNLPLLINSFDKLNMDRGKIKLTVAGTSHPNSPQFLDKIKAEYNGSNIEYIGYVEESSLQKLFDQSVAVVLPYSTSAGSSGVFHLAMSFGKPVVASDIPDLREIEKNEDASAIFVKKGDVDSMTNALKMVLENKNLRISMGKQNLRAARKYDFKYVADEYIKILLEKHRTI